MDWLVSDWLYDDLFGMSRNVGLRPTADYVKSDLSENISSKAMKALIKTEEKDFLFEVTILGGKAIRQMLTRKLPYRFQVFNCLTSSSKWSQ